MQDLEISVWVRSPRAGRALMPVTLMCLLWFSEARPEAQLCLPRPLSLGTWAAVTLGPGVLNTGTGTGVMGLFLRMGSGGSSGAATWSPGQAREAASRFCGAWERSSRVGPQAMPIPEPPH